MRLKKSFVLFGCLFLLSTILILIAASKTASNTKPLTKQAAPISAGKTRIAEAYGKLPLSFEANQGQTDKRVRFLSRGNGYSLFLTPTESVLTLRGPAEPRSAGSQPTPGAAETTALRPNRGAVLRMKLLGANPTPPATGLEELPGKSNYFIGNDPKQWRTNVPNYGKVRFAGVYPGVDLVYYGNQRQLEYDFVVAPGSDPATIRLGFAGAERLEIDPQGELTLETRAGEVRWHKPVVYQEVGGVRQMVEGHYVRKGKEAVGFAIASYDPRHPLIIDPVLLYSTYLGGSGSDEGFRIAVDSTGNAYVTGRTVTNDFPGTSSSLIQAANGGGSDAFVTKLKADGSALVYSTYLGGSGNENNDGSGAAIGGIAVDSFALGNNAYVTGSTSSTDFPGTSTSLIQPTNHGGLDAFVTKLNGAGNALVYSTYLGGNDLDEGLGIAVDSLGNAYVTGETGSGDFPTVNASQPAYGGFLDAFVTKLNATGSALVYSTYLGGSNSTDQGQGIAVDSLGNAYVTGTTGSGDFPTLNAFQDTSGGIYDAFVTRYDLNGVLVYSTYLGGSGVENAVGPFGAGIAVDSSGNAYVTGRTSSTDFPGTSTSLIQPTNHGGFDAFVTKLNGAGNALVYSTYLGGTDIDEGLGIAVDSSIPPNAYVTGYTWSSNFPTASPIQPANGGGYDAFVTKLNAAGSALVYSTYLGGSLGDIGLGIAVDSLGNAYVTGETGSSNFPTASPFQAAINGAGSDPFVLKIGDAPTTTGLTLVKVVINDNGGAKTLTDFPLSAGGPTPITSQVSGTAGATNVAVAPGTYLLSEVLQAGYTAGAWGCVLTGTATPATMPTATTVSVGLGQNITCTITNDDNPATLILVKETAGTSTVASGVFNFTGTGSGVTPGPFSFPVAGGVGSVSFSNISAGAKSLTETVPAGWTATGLSCSTPVAGDGTSSFSTGAVPVAAGGTLTANITRLGLGSTVRCLFGNTLLPRLTLVKIVNSTSGGIKTLSDFPLTATGTSVGSTPTPITNRVSGTAGATNVTVNPGTYALSEQTQAGYTASAWVCVGGSQGDATHITLAPGNNATCTITNTATPTPQSIITDLDYFDMIGAIDPKFGGQLLQKLTQAANLRAAGDCAASSGIYSWFINQLNQGVRNGKVTAAAAATLIADANYLIVHCP